MFRYMYLIDNRVIEIESLAVNFEGSNEYFEASTVVKEETLGRWIVIKNRYGDIHTLTNIGLQSTDVVFFSKDDVRKFLEDIAADITQDL